MENLLFIFRNFYLKTDQNLLNRNNLFQVFFLGLNKLISNSSQNLNSLSEKFRQEEHF